MKRLTVTYTEDPSGGIILNKRPWKNRKRLSEIIMPDGFKIVFWLYEWNEEVAAKLGHQYCVRMLKSNPEGRFLFTEQIGVRLENWKLFLEAINDLKVDNLKTCSN